MEYERNTEGKSALAIFLGLVIIGLSFILSVDRNPQTGQISINAMVIVLGLLVGVLVYLALTFRGRENLFLRMRFCVSCGRSIPFDAVICPYCRYDYEKNFNR